MKTTTKSDGNLERFIELVRGKPALRAQLEKERDLDALVDRAVRMGAENGCWFTAEEFREKLGPKPSADGQLSDAQLEQVSGGWLGNFIKQLLGG
jgi:predicted ribosomally synthesized peptide with nif11-like leader